MPATILIIEPRPEVAKALEDVVTSARYVAFVTPQLVELSDLGISPAAIVVRIAFEGIGEPAHSAIAHLPPNHPPVIAIAWDEREAAEAERLKCEVILKGPRELSQLCRALDRIVRT